MSCIETSINRQTDILFDVYVYIVTPNGLQYNTHDSGYSNKQGEKRKKGVGEKKGGNTMNGNRTKSSFF